MNFKYKEGDTGYVMSRKDGYIPVTIVSQVEYEGEPHYELDKLITIDKNGNKIGSKEYDIIPEWETPWGWEEGYDISPCDERNIFHLGEPCPSSVISFMLNNFDTVLTEDMINRTKKF